MSDRVPVHAPRVSELVEALRAAVAAAPEQWIPDDVHQVLARLDVASVPHPDDVEAAVTSLLKTGGEIPAAVSTVLGLRDHRPEGRPDE